VQIQVLDETATPIPGANVYETGSGGAYLGPYAWGTTTDTDGWATIPEGLSYVTFSFAGSAVTYAGDALPATVTIGANQLSEVVIRPEESAGGDIAPFVLIGAVAIGLIFLIIYNK